jgi:hypothetical protein
MYVGKRKAWGWGTGIYILGTRRWELQVLLAGFRLQPREEVSATASRDAAAWLGAQSPSQIWCHHFHFPWWGRHPGASCPGTGSAGLDYPRFWPLTLQVSGNRVELGLLWARGIGESQSHCACRTLTHHRASWVEGLQVQMGR